MKQFLTAICLVLITGLTTASAQPYGDYTGTATPYKTTLDTVANTAADTFDAQIPGTKGLVVLQHNMKKISGDPSAVTVKIYLSADKGVTYCTTPVVSVTCPDGDTAFYHVFTGNPGTNYRTIITGSGTQSGSHQSFLNIR